MTLWLSLSTAFVLGCIHALEIDHMVAVTAFVRRQPAVATAARFGLRWGLGHSAAVLVAGAVVLATGIRWSSAWDRLAEATVGLALIGVGLWSLRSTRNLHVHLPAEHGDHAHLHAHAAGGAPHHHTHGADAPGPPPSHGHRAARGMTAVGFLHGLAGTSAVVALVPVTLVDRTAAGVGYLLAFGAGVTAAMVVFAGVAAVALRRTSDRSVRWGRLASGLAGWAGLGVGGWWLARALLAA